MLAIAQDTSRSQVRETNLTVLGKEVSTCLAMVLQKLDRHLSCKCKKTIILPFVVRFSGSHGMVFALGLNMKLGRRAFRQCWMRKAGGEDVCPQDAVMCAERRIGRTSSFTAQPTRFVFAYGVQCISVLSIPPPAVPAVTANFSQAGLRRLRKKGDEGWPKEGREKWSELKLP